jgi:hypothetical protein
VEKLELARDLDCSAEVGLERFGLDELEELIGRQGEIASGLAEGAIGIDEQFESASLEVVERARAEVIGGCVRHLGHDGGRRWEFKSEGAHVNVLAHSRCRCALKSIRNRPEER